MGRLLIDDPDPLHPGGATLVYPGAAYDDQTGDLARDFTVKIKRWASDINAMTAELYTSAAPLSSISATLAAAQDDYLPPAWDPGVTNRLILMPAAGGSILTGLDGLDIPDDFAVRIVNPSGADYLELDIFGSSAAGNQFAGSTNMRLLPYGSGVIRKMQAFIGGVDYWVFQ